MWEIEVRHEKFYGKSHVGNNFTDKRTDGRTDGQMNRRTDGRMVNFLTIFESFFCGNISFCKTQSSTHGASGTIIHVIKRSS
jgi:hypothetical protein